MKDDSIRASQSLPKFFLNFRKYFNTLENIIPFKSIFIENFI